MGRRNHRLITPHRVLCKCGNVFTAKNHSKKYCSEECKKKFVHKKWSDNWKEFNKEHPELCNICGCMLFDTKFKSCLQCRIKNRLYTYKNKNKNKKNETTN